MIRLVDVVLSHPQSLVIYQGGVGPHPRCKDNLTSLLLRSPVSPLLQGDADGRLDRRRPYFSRSFDKKTWEALDLTHVTLGSVLATCSHPSLPPARVRVWARKVDEGGVENGSGGVIAPLQRDSSSTPT